ncbi:MAG: prepilin-type N-terminal cleavage/methylation domain-containing protein [Acetobacteraceae bacterium]|nr:prepilin-type N-terminal cleavage/methylation domain-containing protein [Acetobacteraceae bacterium]
MKIGQCLAAALSDPKFTGATMRRSHYTVRETRLVTVNDVKARQGPMNEASPAATGFTLIEVLLVVVIFALVAGLVLTRAPTRGGTTDLRAASSLVAGTLRVARTRAIVADRPMPVRFDPSDATLQLGTDPVRRLPPGIRIASAVSILFRPDGSSSGGAVDLAGRADTAHIAVSWLTGRVTIAAANTP